MFNEDFKDSFNTRVNSNTPKGQIQLKNSAEYCVRLRLPEREHSKTQFVSVDHKPRGTMNLCKISSFLESKGTYSKCINVMISTNWTLFEITLKRINPFRWYTHPLSFFNNIQQKIEFTSMRKVNQSACTKDKV